MFSMTLSLIRYQRRQEQDKCYDVKLFCCQAYHLSEDFKSNMSQKHDFETNEEEVELAADVNQTLVEEGKGRTGDEIQSVE